MQLDPATSEPNNVFAAPIFRRAIEKNDPQAMFYLGVMYLKGFGVETDPVKALGWLTRAAALDSGNSYYLLGVLNTHGIGMRRDVGQGLEYLSTAQAMGQLDAGEYLAACDGNAELQYELGQMFDRGIGTMPENDQIAYEWYRSSAQKGHVGAKFQVGLMLLEGRSVHAHKDAAMSLFSEAAEFGHTEALTMVNALSLRLPSALYQLGLLYGRDDVVRHDPQKMLGYIQEAAASGDANPQQKLGEFYIEGMLVGRDQVQAIYWFRQAARQKLDSAELFVNALERECADSLFQIGKRYFHHPQNLDFQLTRQWWERAAELGHAEAISALRSRN